MGSGGNRVATRRRPSTCANPPSYTHGSIAQRAVQAIAAARSLSNLMLPLLLALHPSPWPPSQSHTSRSQAYS
ncbi:unnamed protein product [Lampetra fluviatilis]